MANLFRPGVTYWVVTVAVCRNGKPVTKEDGKPLTKKKRVPKGTPGARKKRVRSRAWYGQYRDADRTRKRVPLGTDKEAARFKLAELVRKVDREKNGYADPFEKHGERKLSEHLAEYRDHLVAKGNAPDYIDQTVHRVELVTESCRFSLLRDLQGAKVDNWLATKKAAGKSAATLNSYLTSMRGFCQWLVDEDRMRKSPLDHLDKQDEQADRRRERRAASPEEFAWLIETAQESRRPFHRLWGPDRAMLYTVAAFTGLRVSELASLTRASLILEGDPPTLTVQAAYSKRRRRDQQPMPKWLADRVSAWLADRGPPLNQTVLCLDAAEAMQAGREAADVRLWPGGWPARAAEMLKMDLEAARAKWIKQAASPAERSRRERSDFLLYWNHADQVADFHALRHRFTSSLAAAGVHPKVAQQLSRHSTIDLTMNVYTHLQVADVVGAVESLPEPAPITPEGQQARATGTDGECTPRDLHPPNHPPLPGFSGHSVSASGTEGGNEGGSAERQKPQETLEKHRESSGGHGTRTRKAISGPPHFQCGR